MECVRCFNPNDPHRRFCGQCGAALVSLCQRCGFFNRVVDHFCGGCGDALGGAPATDRAPVQTAPPLAPRQLSSPPAPARKSAPAAASPAPAAPHESAPVPRNELLSKQDLSDLLKPAPAHSAPPLPQRVSQDDLDKLFAK